MRLIKLLTLLFLLAAGTAQAQDEAVVYRISDVAVDVTAASSALARDQAIFQAQRQAFEQLMGRLGAEGAGVQKQSDDAIAAMVQALEVQKEHAQGQRYIGTFTVQFRPGMVRDMLAHKGLTYTEARAKPFIVLPITRSGGRDMPWDGQSPWRAAWEEAARKAGLIPLIVPGGDLDDVTKMSTAEAVAGKPEPLHALAAKYEASGALVAIWNEPAEGAPVKDIKIEVLRLAAGEQNAEKTQVTLPAPATPKALAEAYLAGAKQVERALESGWRKTSSASGSSVAAGPAAHLAVNVPVPTLAAWAQIKQKIARAPLVAQVQVISMTRGLVRAEVEFHGTIEDLQSAVAAQGLILQHGSATPGWEILAAMAQ